VTLRANARLAGLTFLLYIATGLTSLALFNRASAGEGPVAQLASLARQAPLVRLTVVLTLLTFVIAVTLAVTLYALTRDQDHDVALIALCCRATEGVLAAVSAVQTLQLLAVARASTAAAPDAAVAQALGGVLLRQGGWSASIAATCFAVGSLLYSWLFLRARSIPAGLAGLGVVASLLLVVLLPVQLAGLLQGPVTSLMWIPMAVFEVTLGFWLLLKGVAVPERER